MAMAFCPTRSMVACIVATIWCIVYIPQAVTTADTAPSQAPQISPPPSSAPPNGNVDGHGPAPSSHVAQVPLSPSPSESPSSAPRSSTSPPGPSNSPEPSGAEIAEPPEEDEEGPPEVGPRSNNSILWCAVRDEFADCQYYIDLLNGGAHDWSCVQKQSAMECMEAIKREEVDLINLDAGLAYIAFTNYSMKAIMAEEYCYHRRSYEAVAVVNKVSCHENPRLTLEDFRGRRSCHSGYRTAAGWNLPVLYFVKNGLQALPLVTDEQTDEEVVHNFFSEACAPSEFPGHGLCDSCGNNGSCDASVDKYRGYSGAFRCLVEGLGDIAFLRSDAVSRLSTDGISAQNWSTKSVDEFMYLCPDRGCKPISDNVGDCKFASVPSNVIMTSNSQSNAKKNAIVKALLNASWSDFLYSGKNPQDHIFSGSTQGLAELQELTRSFLGGSARVAEAMDSLQNVNISVVPTSDGCYRLSRFLNSRLISCIVMIISLFSVFL